MQDAQEVLEHLIDKKILKAEESERFKRKKLKEQKPKKLKRKRNSSSSSISSSSSQENQIKRQKFQQSQDSTHSQDYDFYESSDGSDMENQYSKVCEIVNKFNKNNPNSINPILKNSKDSYLHYKKQEVKIHKSGMEQLNSQELGEMLKDGVQKLDFKEVEELMQKYNIQDNLQLNQILNGEKFNYQNQVKLFQTLYQQGFFTKSHQKKIKLVKQLQLFQRKDFLTAQLHDIQQQLRSMTQTDELINTLILSDEMSTSESQNTHDLDQRDNVEMDNPKSDYNKQRRRDIKELSKQFAKEAIKRHNKKQLQAFTFTSESRLPGRMRPSLNELVDEDFDISWVATSERFKNFNRTKQILTIIPCGTDEMEEYRKQEYDRYKFPLNPWMYNISDGRKAIVGPVYRKKAQLQSKPKEHPFLKNHRPPAVNILAVVRDAAARLPDGVGTRTDVAELVKDSQFIAEGLSDYYISQTVSGGLDRLSAEEDPSVRFDPSSKLWIYLHGKRTLDSTKWVSEISETKKVDYQKANERFFIHNPYVTIPSPYKQNTTGSHQGTTNDTTEASNTFSQ
eukprot:403333211